MRRLWVAAPLAFAALLMAHPMGDTFYEAGGEHNTAWLTVHVGAAVFFPLMAAVVWRLLRGLDGRAARFSRGSLLTFAVLYTAWEVMTGIATGVLAGAGDVEGVERLTTHWISGELGVFNSVGALAWTAAIAAAVIALRAAGARRGALVGLGLSALMVMHIPPIGPIALLGLATAVVLSRRPRRDALRDWAQTKAVAEHRLAGSRQVHVDPAPLGREDERALGVRRGDVERRLVERAVVDRDGRARLEHLRGCRGLLGRHDGWQFARRLRVVELRDRGVDRQEGQVERAAALRRSATRTRATACRRSGSAGVSPSATTHDTWGDPNPSTAGTAVNSQIRDGDGLPDVDAAGVESVLAHGLGRRARAQHRRVRGQRAPQRIDVEVVGVQVGDRGGGDGARLRRGREQRLARRPGDLRQARRAGQQVDDGGRGGRLDLDPGPGQAANAASWLLRSVAHDRSYVTARTIVR